MKTKRCFYKEDRRNRREKEGESGSGSLTDRRGFL
jgi:hypothetical protein